MASTWSLHPDRAFPSEPTQRGIAREIYGQVSGLPLISMHGHIDVQAIRENRPFGDPTELFVIPDHYLRRMLVSQGFGNHELGVAPVHASADVRVETDHRLIWRRFCENWKLFRGTPTRYWLEHELVEIFGVTVEPSAETADLVYDELAEALARPEFHIRPLFDRFNIEILSTTDAPQSDLSAHAALADDGWGERVVPTFRPDALFYPDRAGWADGIRSLAERSGVEVGDYAGLRPERGRAPTGTCSPTPLRSVPPTPRESSTRPCAHRSTERAPQRSPPTCCSRPRGCRWTTAW
jgi:glucuronate isomerase